MILWFTQLITVTQMSTQLSPNSKASAAFFFTVLRIFLFIFPTTSKCEEKVAPE